MWQLLKAASDIWTLLRSVLACLDSGNDVPEE